MSESFEFPFQDPELPLVERVADLLARLTVEEKASQMLHESPAIARLGIPAYNWWNEALHGVARAGVATVFPQAIGLAATFDVALVHRLAVAISDEARAKHHEFLRQGDHGQYKGLTFWSPNINLFRDPRWGRGHETYGECPYLTGRMGVAFCKGLQGDDPRYLKLVATPKHFAVHSGPEGLRHGFDARPTLRDLRDSYLPAFSECVREANAQSVMTAYNRVNGEPCSASVTLLEQILRREWGFEGYVVSDCWAIRDIHEHHGVTAAPEESAALALRAGCDLNCGCTYRFLPAALQRGLVSEADLDRALGRLFTARFRLGQFDPPQRVPHAAIPYAVNACDEHYALARKAAQQSIVLLKNAGNLLPLRKDLGAIAVIGPNASDDTVLLGNYHGLPTRVVTPLEGIRTRVSETTRVLYTDGCQRTGTATDGLQRAGNLSEARSVAARADVVILVLGLSALIEGEQGDAGDALTSGDKLDLQLPGLQQRLLEEVTALGKPTVLVLIAGSALDVTWADAHVAAIVAAGYPGEAGGLALADVLFGEANPSGRLPITYPRQLSDLPPFADYAMHGRTYRYATKPALYPFGYGLSYTRFEYSELTLSSAQCSSLQLEGEGELVISVRVTNAGERAGAEIAQLYVKDTEADVEVPHHNLRRFERIELEPRQSGVVLFRLQARDFSLIDEQGQRVLPPGKFRIYVGGSQPDARSVELLSVAPLSAEVEISGPVRALPY